MKSTNFLISGLPLEAFSNLFELDDAGLAAVNARRCIADSKPGFPCRVSLEDAEIGESIILLTYEHHAVDGPYRGTGPVYVRQSAKQAQLKVNELPDVVKRRLISVRAYNSQSLMVASEVVEGSNLEEQIDRFFSDEQIQYLHLHNAKPGCFSCRVDRAAKE
ncbi:DUF1203 domain-containing protein [bacterium]|nr:DUF1203 domain-containing protein [bacterium]MCI0606935.1 DUF1203 domain-containing protein [bacterium]